MEERKHGGGMRVTEKEKSKPEKENLPPFGFCLHVLSPPSQPLSPSGFFLLVLSPPPPSPSFWLPPQPLIISLSLSDTLLSVFLLGKSFPLCSYLGLTAASTSVVFLCVFYLPWLPSKKQFTTSLLIKDC